MKLQIALLSAVVSIVVAAPVTFHKDVEPVLQKHCQSCHRPGEAAPMSFLTYPSTRPWAKAMKNAVAAKRMPPWFADPDHGRFRNDPTLSDAERNAIIEWANSGTLEGDLNSAPPPLKFIEGWNIGVPEKVLEMPKDFSVPANGDIEYQHLVIPTGFTEDKWVKAVELRPGNRAVVHHIIAFVRPPGSKWLRDATPGVAVTDRLSGWPWAVLHRSTWNVSGCQNDAQGGHQGVPRRPSDHLGKPSIYKAFSPKAAKMVKAATLPAGLKTRWRPFSGVTGRRR